MVHGMLIQVCLFSEGSLPALLECLNKLEKFIAVLHFAKAVANSGVPPGSVLHLHSHELVP